jgi:hypothetical protein
LESYLAEREDRSNEWSQGGPLLTAGSDFDAQRARGEKKR